MSGNFHMSERERERNGMSVFGEGYQNQFANCVLSREFQMLLIHESRLKRLIGDPTSICLIKICVLNFLILRFLLFDTLGRITLWTESDILPRKQIRYNIPMKWRWTDVVETTLYTKNWLENWLIKYIIAL